MIRRNVLPLICAEKKLAPRTHQDWQSEEVKAEELRLLYVALTRAMNRCYIYLPEQKTEKSPLAHLFESSNGGSLFDQVTAFAQSSKGCVSASSEPGELSLGPGRNAPNHNASVPSL